MILENSQQLGYDLISGTRHRLQMHSVTLLELAVDFQEGLCQSVHTSC